MIGQSDHYSISERAVGSIEKKKLSDAVIEEIRRRFETGELKAGDKLPNQIEFAAQLGVSRVVLREALHTLTLIGAIDQRPGFGTVIKAANLALWAEQLSPPFVSDMQATLELIEARRFIETAALELATANASPDDLSELGRLIDEMRKALADKRVHEYSEFDMAFHFRIASASHNRFMIHAFVTIRGLMEQFIREAFTVMPGLLERSLEFHIQIYEALRAKNKTKAVGSMRSHIRDIERAIRKYYESIP
jgi:GntR family transcriptional regulator, transcriptional repressor for pyruvate dehydrogenase complex